MGGSTRRIHPLANTTAQWWENDYARATFSRIEKILLHTTETTGWPGYKAGASAPTLTYHPRLREWRQHNYLDRSARALVDPSGTAVRENRDNVIQIEIICYSDEPKGRSVGGLPVSELTDAQLKDLGDFIAWVRQQWGGPPLVAPRFLPYPSSYGNSAVRMTGPEYDAYQGIVGHQHASGNTHGDPGSLNVARVLQHAGASTAATVPEEDIVTPEDIEKIADRVRDKILWAPTFPDQKDTLGASSIRNNIGMGASFGQQSLALLHDIAGKVGVDFDEAALASALAPLLAEPVADALAARLPEQGITRDDVTAAVRDVFAQLGQG